MSDVSGGDGHTTRTGVKVAGIVCLGVAASASLLLVLEHLAGLSLPGCGGGSPCAKAAESVWGKVPYVGWPVSFIGVAYFAGLLTAWPNLRRGAPAAIRWLVRLGVLISVAYTAIMFRGGYVCPYCLATHIGNVLFWALLEFGTGGARRAARPLTTLVGTFAAVSLILGAAAGWGRTAARATAETQARASRDAILTASTQPTTTTSAPAEDVAAPTPETAFTGRYRLGPQAAAIRIVVFMDYMCKGCHLIELELQKILEHHTDVSFSVKPWPGNSECNPYPGEREHVYACTAARAAEAAGLLGGNDVFWKMHFWLFKHNGRFTDDELRSAAIEFGLDGAEFDRLRKDDLTLRLVQADIDEGFSYGLASTPLIFINGIEFKGWAAPLALTKVVDQLSEKSLPVRTAAADHPLAAGAAFVFQWRQARVRELPAVERTWPYGPAGAKLQIVVWGDYLQPNTAKADGIIREFMRDRADTQYTFHPYPLNPQCNAAVEEVQHPAACRAAQAALAAGALGGADGYWKLHAWLLENQADFSDEILRGALPQLGFEPDAFFAKMDAAAVLEAVANSAQAGKQVGLQNAPLMFLNGKVVPRWLHGGQPMLRGILDAAATDRMVMER